MLFRRCAFGFRVVLEGGFGAWLCLIGGRILGDQRWGEGEGGADTPRAAFPVDCSPSLRAVARSSVQPVSTPFSTIWRLCVGSPSASNGREAGAITSDKRGNALHFNNPFPQVKGVVAAAPGLHADLAGRLAQWPD